MCHATEELEIFAGSESGLGVDRKDNHGIILFSDESSVGEAGAEKQKKHINESQRKPVVGMVIMTDEF